MNTTDAATAGDPIALAGDGEALPALEPVRQLVQAQEAALAGIRAGTTGVEADALARNIIAQYHDLRKRARIVEGRHGPILTLARQGPVGRVAAGLAAEGGRCRVESQPGVGTKVIVEVNR